MGPGLKVSVLVDSLFERSLRPTSCRNLKSNGQISYYLSSVCYSLIIRLLTQLRRSIFRRPGSSNHVQRRDAQQVFVRDILPNALHTPDIPLKLYFIPGKGISFPDPAAKPVPFSTCFYTADSYFSACIAMARPDGSVCFDHVGVHLITVLAQYDGKCWSNMVLNQ